VSCGDNESAPSPKVSRDDSPRPGVPSRVQTALHGGVRIELTAGPDAGWQLELGAGRHLVGRTLHCDVVIQDPAVEPHHVLLTIDEQGHLDVVQLAGRMPLAIGFASASYIDVGDSRLDLRPRRPTSGLMLGVTVPDPLGGGGGEPVLLGVDSLAIVDDHPELARGHAIVRSLRSQAQQRGLTAPAHLLAAPDDPALDGCTSILEIGARWRGRWTPDVSQPQYSVRLHAAGLAESRSCQG
jgi:Inner membrane component of T3SS, cytoplasmic domain